MKDCRPDLELATKALRGDPSAWRRIYDETFDRLFSLLCYQIGDREEARDLLQETYLQAFRRIDRYRGEAPLESWLRAIALRKAIDWKRTALRRLKRTVRLGENQVAEETGDPQVLFDSERRALRAALDRLSPAQRAALLLREWEGRSFREIGQMLGCGENTARVHHTRARVRARRALEPRPVGIECDGLEGTQP